MKITSQIKNKLNSILSIFNLYLQKRNPGIDPVEQLVQGLNYFNIDFIFDIGANTGQFSSEIINNGYKGEILSFEPLTIAHKELVIKSSKHENWIVYERCAVGDFEGEIEINISNNSVSSSILDISSLHLNAAEESKFIGSEKSRIIRLDSLLNIYQFNDKNLFVKIDTQGFEWQVLEGAEEILKISKGVLCELSFDKLYEGQRLWQDIIKKLEKYNFKLWSIQYGLTDKSTGQSLQCDAIFYKIN